MQAARGASLNPSDPSDPDLTSRPGPPATYSHARGHRRAIALFAAVAAVAYMVDVVTKVLVVARLSGHPPVEVVGHYLTLYVARNAGAAFSTATSHTLLLSLVAIVAAACVLWVSRRLASTGWAIGLGFLLAGIAGNLTDRVFREPGFLRGHVVDFFMFPHFPVFNVADVCINIAAVVIVVQALRGMRVDGTRAQDGDEAEEQ
jgi:signal peptidase II